MQIRKVKYSKGTIMVTCQDQNLDHKLNREMVITSEQEPRPEFVKAFKSMADAGLREIGAPKQWLSGGNCTGASFSSDDKTGVLGVVATIQVAIDGFNSPLVINTPHKREKGDEDRGNGPFLDGPFLQASLDLMDEAVAYAKGVRAQLDLEDILSRPMADEA